MARYINVMFFYRHNHIIKKFVYKMYEIVYKIYLNEFCILYVYLYWLL